MPRKKIKEPNKELTPASIMQMVDDMRKGQAYNDLVQQIDTDFDLFTLKPYEYEQGHQSYTSPKPLNDFDKVLTGINKASLTWNIAVPEDAPEEERNAANKGEQILTGILNQADEQLSENGEPPLREGLGWFGCARGAVGVLCLIYPDDEKNTVIDIRYADVLHMAWEKGHNGLNWWSYEYTMSKIEAQERYNKEVKSDTVRIIDFYTRKINAVVLVDGTTEDGKQFVKEPVPHGLDHVPAWIEFAGSMPSVYNRNHELQLKYRAKSVWTSSRGIYEPFNKQVSFIMDTAEKSVAGTLLFESEDGTRGIKGDPWEAWQVIRIKKDKENIRPLEPPKVPAESAAILDILDKDLNQSTVPYPIGYGLDPQAHSGAALSMINDNTRSIYDPFSSLLERAYKWLCKEILIQFKAKGQKITLKGFNSDGKFWTVDASPDDIMDGWYINVKCEPKLPRDEAAELQMALAATQGRPPYGRPLISDYTAREKIIKLQNPDSEDKRIEEETVKRMIEQIPQIQVRRLAMELANQGDLEGAKELLASVPSPQGGQPQPGQPQPGAMQGQPPPQGAGGIPQVNPQQLEQLAMLAAKMQAEGKPIPPQLKAILQANMQPQGTVNRI